MSAAGMTCPNSVAFHKTITKFDEFMEALDQFEYALADSGLGGGVQEKIERVLRDGYPTEEGIHYVERRTAILNMYLPTGRKTKRARCDAAVGDAKAEVNADTIPTDATTEAARCTTCGWSMWRRPNPG